MSDIILSVDGDLKPLESKLNKISSRNISLNLKDSLSQPLGRITGKVSEFEKSLEASNARVLAFGASAGSVYAVQRAFSEIVKSTIEVEKSLTDINVVLNASTKDLGKFGKELFSIAKNTGQGFDEVAKAATEFARQGLGIEETLKRTNDALILSRLSGLDAARSVETLTAAVNSFARAGLTSSQIINKLANVDAAFAVSTGDLAEAISRVGSTAQDVGVDFDQLIAIVTAAQQTTARGGAVIGNSFKTIFTRLQRTDTLDELEAVGIAVRDLQGNTLPAIQILKNLSDVFYQLNDAQRASVAETVGGVFQINILRAALSDLTKQYSVYDSALSTARSSTDQAIQRNQALNQTLSALTNKTFVNLKEAAAKIGEITLAPTIKTGLGGINAILGEFNKPEEAQGIGTKIATGLLKGIGSYISGPGLAIIGAAFIKIFGGLTKFSAEALKSLIGIGTQADKIAAAQERVNAIIAQNPALIQAVISKETSLLQVENQILKIIEQQNAARAVGATISARVAPLAANVPTPKIKTKFGGYIPNFVSPTMQEKMGAYAGGYTPGSVKKMGDMYYNTAESIAQFPGADGPAIMPPQNSLAGENYRNAFKKQVGFDPYAYRGYVPNFADKERKKYTKIVDTGRQNKVGMIFPYKTNKAVDAFGYAKYGDYKIKIGFPMSGYNPANIKKPADVDLIKQLGDKIVTFTNDFAKKLFQGGGQMPQITNISQLSNAGSFGSIAGAIFESAVGLATSNLNEGRDQNAPIDFAAPNDKLRALFNNLSASAFEAKVNPRPDQRDSVAQKILNLGYVGGKTKEILGESYAKDLKDRQLKEKELAARKAAEQGIQLGRGQKISSAKRTKSFGYIPNFAALQDAIIREQAAGVNPNLIRVGTSSSLVSRDNPFGLGVYNTKDEPGGLQQGINRYSGVIPNFAGGNKITDVTSMVESAKKASEALNKTANSSKNLSDKVNDNQGKLVALGVGLSLLQGQLSQFGDANNKFIQGLNQMTSAAATVSTAFGTFGGGKKGLAAAGGMLAIQGVAGLSGNADKTFNTQMQNLSKAMETSKESSSKLEAVISGLTPTLNDYANELEKTDPDPEAIAKFKKSILTGISDLAPELQDQIREKLGSAKDIMGTLSTEQRKGALTQSQIGLQQLVGSEQGQARANMGIKGQFGKILAGTGIPGLANFGQGLMNKEMKPTFQNKESISAAAGAALLPVSQSSEDLLKVADALAANSTSAEGTFQALEELYKASGQSTEGLLALKAELSKNPEATKKVIEEMKKLTQTQLQNAAAAGKAAVPVAPGYRGAGKLYGPGMVAEQYQAQPIDDLNSTLSRLAMISGKGPAADMLRNKIGGRAAIQQAEAGMPVSEQYKEMGAKFYAGRIKEQEARLAELQGMTGDVEGQKKTQAIIDKTNYDKMGTQVISENIAEAGKDKPQREKMGENVPELTAEQKKTQEAAAASAEAAKNLENASAIQNTNLSVPNIPPQTPELDMFNTALTAAGGLAGPFLGTLGGNLFGKGTSAVGRGAGTAINTVARATPLIGGALTTSLGSMGVAGLAGSTALAAGVGYGTYKGSEKLGEYFDPGAEKRTSMLESIPGAKKGLSWWSQNAPEFLGGGGASALTEEEQKAQDEALNKLKNKKLTQQQVQNAPKVEAPAGQIEEASKTAETKKQEQPSQVNNNISVAPSINIAQQAATDKAELQKMIEAEVKKFGEAIVKIAENKAKAREKGVVNPPQNLNITA